MDTKYFIPFKHIPTYLIVNNINKLKDYFNPGRAAYKYEKNIVPNFYIGLLFNPKISDLYTTRLRITLYSRTQLAKVPVKLPLASSILEVLNMNKTQDRITYIWKPLLEELVQLRDTNYKALLDLLLIPWKYSYSETPLNIAGQLLYYNLNPVLVYSDQTLAYIQQHSTKEQYLFIIASLAFGSKYTHWSIDDYKLLHSRPKKFIRDNRISLAGILALRHPTWTTNTKALLQQKIYPKYLDPTVRRYHPNIRAKSYTTLAHTLYIKNKLNNQIPDEIYNLRDWNGLSVKDLKSRSEIWLNKYLYAYDLDNNSFEKNIIKQLNESMEQELPITL